MIDSQDVLHMRSALKLAEEAARSGEVPVGSLLVDASGMVISAARNAKEGLGDPTAHAEIQVIRDAAQKLMRWRLSELTLYSTLEPCVMCAGAIVHARLKRVVFGAADPKFGGVVSLYSALTDPRLNHRCQVRSGVLAEESAVLLRSFFRERRKRNRLD